MNYVTIPGFIFITLLLKIIFMNTILFVFSLFLASSSQYGHNQNGKVYFIRSEGLQAPAAAFNLFIDQKMIGKLNNKRFSMHDVNAGKHVFSTRFVGKKPSEKAEKIEMQIERNFVFM